GPDALPPRRRLARGLLRERHALRGAVRVSECDRAAADDDRDRFGRRRGGGGGGKRGDAFASVAAAVPAESTAARWRAVDSGQLADGRRSALRRFPAARFVAAGDRAAR